MMIIQTQQRWFILCVGILVMLTTPIYAQDSQNWLGPVIGGDLEVESLTGGSLTGQLAQLKGVLRNVSPGELSVTAVTGDVLEPSDTSSPYCTLILVGGGESFTVPAGGTAKVIFHGYCLQPPSETTKRPDDQANYAPPNYRGQLEVVAESIPAIVNVRDVLGRAQDANLDQMFVTQLAIWQVVGGLDDVALSEQSGVADLSRFAVQLDYLVNGTPLPQEAQPTEPPANDTSVVENGTDEVVSSGTETAPLSTANPVDNLIQLLIDNQIAVGAILITILLLGIGLFAINLTRKRKTGASQTRGSNTTTTTGQSAATVQAAASEPQFGTPTIGDAPDVLPPQPTNRKFRWAEGGQSVAGGANQSVRTMPGGANRPASRGNKRSGGVLPQAPSVLPRSRNHPNSYSGGQASNVSSGYVPAETKVPSKPNWTQPATTTPSDSSISNSSDEYVRPHTKVSKQVNERKVQYVLEVNGQRLGQLGNQGGIITRTTLQGPGRQIVLGEAYSGISAPHAVIRFEHDEAWLRDLNSSNGTAVDGAPVEAGQYVKLENGAYINLGREVTLTLDIHQRVMRHLNDPDKMYQLARDSKVEILLTRKHVDEVKLPTLESISTPHLLIEPQPSSMYGVRIRELAPRNSTLVNKEPLRTEGPPQFFRGDRKIDLEIDGQLFQLDVRRSAPMKTISDRFSVRQEVYASDISDLLLVNDSQAPNEPKIAKVLLPVQAKPDEARRLFAQEAKLMRALSMRNGQGHASILPVLDEGRVESYGPYQHQPYFVMPYLRGASLNEILLKRNRGRQAGLPMAAIKHVYDAILPALHSLHRYNGGYVHCDIKPGNIFIDTKGQVYLLDFGAAVMRGEQAEFYSKYYSGYETQNQQVVYETADIYSLGAILFEMLTGRGAKYVEGVITRGHGAHEIYTAAKRDQSLFDEIQERIQSIEREFEAGGHLFNKAYGPPFKEVIQKATRPNAGNRYPDIPTLQHAFDAVYDEPAVDNALSEEDGAIWLAHLAEEIESERTFVK